LGPDFWGGDVAPKNGPRLAAIFEAESTIDACNKNSRMSPYEREQKILSYIISK